MWVPDDTGDVGQPTNCGRLSGVGPICSSNRGLFGLLLGVDDLEVAAIGG